LIQTLTLVQFVSFNAEGSATLWVKGNAEQRARETSRRSEGPRIDLHGIGAVALLAHGYPRFTEDIDIVLTPRADSFHRELIGLVTCRRFWSKKKLSSTRDGVSIKVMTTGEYPGDGKPKPVSIPEPATASIEIDGVRFVTFEKLIELKLASGMTARID